MGAKESGQSLLAGVLAKLPEADRATAQAIFAKADAEGAITLIGESALARSDYSKQMDTIREQTTALEAKQTELTEWWEVNKDALLDYKAIKPEFDKLKTTPPARTTPDPNPPPAGLTKEEFDKDMAIRLEARDRIFAGALGFSVTLAQKHFVMFHEALDMNELLRDPKIGTVDKTTGDTYGLMDAYNNKHGDRVSTKLKEIKDAEFNKAVDDKVNERLRSSPQHPFPIRDSSPSPLDALTTPEKKTTDFTVDSAVAFYEQLQANKAAGTAP
jgi:hypothetical protein